MEERNLTEIEALDTAIYNEKLTGDHYRNLADSLRKAGNESVAAFFDEQSKREKGHYNSLVKHREKHYADSTTTLGETVKWITPEVTAPSEAGPGFDIDNALRLVEEGERTAERYYQRAAQTAANDELKELFGKLAHDEGRHGYLLQKVRTILETKGVLEPTDYEDLGFG